MELLLALCCGAGVVLVLLVVALLVARRSVSADQGAMEAVAAELGWTVTHGAASRKDRWILGEHQGLPAGAFAWNTTTYDSTNRTVVHPFVKVVVGHRSAAPTGGRLVRKAPVGPYASPAPAATDDPAQAFTEQVSPQVFSPRTTGAALLLAQRYPNMRLGDLDGAMRDRFPRRWPDQSRVVAWVDLPGSTIDSATLRATLDDLAAVIQTLDAP